MDRWIKECEELLCSSTNQRGNFDAYLAGLAPKDCGGQCTAIWPAGALAYRCRTCQLTSSSAVCVSCFKAGGHEDHDWIQYRSPSGGCCDCGDLSAWRVEGCCPAHQPGRRVVPLEQLLPPQPRALLEAVLEAALARFMECLAHCTGSRGSAEKRREALTLCNWLQRFASLAPVRRTMSDVLRRPLEQPPQEQEHTNLWHLQRRLDLLRETKDVVRQQKLVWQQQDQRLQQLQERIQSHIDRLREARVQEEERLQRLRDQYIALSAAVAAAGDAAGGSGDGPSPSNASEPGTGAHVATVVIAATPVTATTGSVLEDVTPDPPTASAVVTAGAAAAAAAVPETAAVITSPGAAIAAATADLAAAAATIAEAATSISPADRKLDSPASSPMRAELPAYVLATKVYMMQAQEVLSRLPRSLSQSQPQQQLQGMDSGSHLDQDCLLRRWVLGLRWLHPETLHHLTSLLLLLLYEAEFKYDTAVYLMECYAPMLSAIGGLGPPQQMPVMDDGSSGGSGRHPLCGVLDRVVVQLFNSEEVTSRLVSERGVMETHLSVLAYLTGAFVDELSRAAANGSADLPRVFDEGSVSEQQLNAILDAMRRLASDFSTLVHHLPAAHYLLSSRELWGEAFLGRFVRPMQAMLPHRRKVSGDVEERAAFRVPLACSAEFVATACVAELLITVAGMRPAAAAARSSGGGTAGESRPGSGGGSDEEPVRRVELLYSAARQALEACEEWCSDRVARSGATALAAPFPGVAAAAGGGGGGPSPRRLSAAADLYEGLLEGELEASPHLPLHRTAAAFVQALLHLEQQGGPTGQLAGSRVKQLLSLHASLDEGSAWRSVSRFLLLGQAFVSQIIARGWLRNGDDVSQVELFVLNGRELTDLDVLMTQCWMAAEDPDVVLYDILSATGAKPLLAAAGVPIPGASRTGGPPPSAAAPAELQDPASAAPCAEALRWLVSLLRERTVAGLDPRERLRSTLVQWLALRDWTYNQLHELLPQDLQQQPHMEQVLVEVATYRAANLSQTRQYSLRREAWEIFCPAFVHYTPSMRSRAWEAAMAAARAPGTASGGGGGGGSGGASEGAGGGVAYQPYWQLRRPRHPLPASLRPMQRVLETSGLWCLVAWVLQAYLSGAPRLPEDTLLGTLNLLALQLHRLEDLLGYLTSPTSGPSEQQQPMQGQSTEANPDQQGLQLTPTPTQIEDQSRLRTSVLTGAVALAGHMRRAVAITNHSAHMQQQQQHSHHRHHYHHDHKQYDSNHQPGSSSSRQAAAAASSGIGIVSLLGSLLQSQTPATGPAAPVAAAKGSRSSAVQLSSETVECLQWLLQTARRLMLAAEVAGVLAPPASATSAGAMQAGTPDEEMQATSNAATGTSIGSDSGAVPGTSEAAEAEAARRRELARQRQAAMMAKLRAQQEAFLKQAAGQGAGAIDSSDQDEEGSSYGETSSSDEDSQQKGGQQQRAVPRDGAEQSAGARAGHEAGLLAGVDDSSSSEGNRGASAEVAGWMSSSLSDDGGDEAGEQGSDAARQESQRSDDVSGSGGRRRPHRHHGPESPGLSTGGHRETSNPVVRQQLPLGRWLSVDAPEPECAVCREGPAGGRHGPLAFIAHTAVCFCTAAPLQLVRAWDEDPETQAAKLSAAVTAAVAVPAAAVVVEGQEQGYAASGDDPLRISGDAPSGMALAARDTWVRAWRQHGPGVGEADLGGGLHVHCCGHMIHTHCFARFVAGQLRQYLAGAHFPGSHLVMPELSEFLCPVCRRLANGIVPAAPFQWRPPMSAAARPKATARTSRTRVRAPVHRRASKPPASTASGLETPFTAAAAAAPNGSDIDVGPGSGPPLYSPDISDSSLPLVHIDRNAPGVDGDGEKEDMGGLGCTVDDGTTVPKEDQHLDEGQSDALTMAGMEGVSASSAVQAIAPSLPPLGHAAGLGGLQGLMSSLELCAKVPQSMTVEAGTGPSMTQGSTTWAGGAVRSQGQGHRSCTPERLFGAYGEVVKMATHQMAREGVNQMARLERALEARSRLMQLRSPPNAGLTASQNLAPQPAPTARPQATPPTPPDGPTTTQQDAQQQARQQPAVVASQPAMGTSVSTASGSVAGSSAADVSGGGATLEPTPEAAMETAGDGNANAGPNASAEPNFRQRRPWLSSWQATVPEGLRFPPPCEPKLACCCRRIPDVAAVWKGLPVHTRLWTALAHNLAHFEAVRRPVTLASGVLGAEPAAVRTARIGDVAAAAAGSAYRGVRSGSGVGGGPAGSSVTGLPAVEMAHWRALMSLAAMAVCGGARLGASCGDHALVPAPPAVPSAGLATPVVGPRMGFGTRAAADTATVPLVLKHPSHPSSQPSSCNSEPLSQQYQQQQNPHLQPLLATFHHQLRWLLCELQTLGVTPSWHPSQLPVTMAAMTRTMTKEAEPTQRQDQDQKQGGSAPSQQPSDDMDTTNPAVGPVEAGPLSQPTPPASSLDWTCGFLRPYLPEIVIPRLEATMSGVEMPSIRSRGAHPQTYFPALALRRLLALDELMADPLLLALELLAVGLSGLTGASLPPPPAEPGLEAPGAAAIATEPTGWLPGSPQQLLRTVLRLVWPIQVLQAALWRTDHAVAKAQLGDTTEQPLAASFAAAAATAGDDPLEPAPFPPATGLGTEEISSTWLVRLYDRALEDLQRQGGQESGHVPQLQGCGDGSPGAELSGLSAALLPFLVRAYALDCALSRQTPDPALMLAYSSLHLSERCLHHQQHPEPRQRHCAAASGRGDAAAPAASVATTGAGNADRGTTVPISGILNRESIASVPSNIAAMPGSDACVGTEAVAAREIATTEEELRARACTVALAGHLVAALGLCDIVDALREPLMLSRRRAAEAIVAAAEAATTETTASTSAGDGGSNSLSNLHVPLSPPSSDFERAVLRCVLSRWCGQRALALAMTATKCQGAQVGVGPGRGGPEVAALASISNAAGDVGAVAPPQPMLTWYRGLPPPPSLIPLPHLFQSLFLHFAEARCPDCGAKPDNPALCLLTGRFVCSLWRGCGDARSGANGFGGGLMHAREHCGGACLLLSLRSTRVVAVRGNRLAMCQSPYLDAHGDEDPDLRRGRPLYLDAACYRQLARLWGSAALEFDTQLLHNSRADLVGL